MGLINMRCPKDAKITIDKIFDKQNIFCNEVYPNNINFICSRKGGHKGKHHAHSYSLDECYAIWDSEEDNKK